MSNTLQPHELQPTRLPCFSLSHWVCSNSCPLSWQCHPTISSPFTPFFSCPQSFPASGSFPMSWLFASGGQNIGASVSSMSSSNEYSGLISCRIHWFDRFAVQGTLKNLLQHHNLKTLILQHSAFFMIQISHPYMTTGKPWLWLCKLLLARWCLCFLICCLGLS